MDTIGKILNDTPCKRLPAVLKVGDSIIVKYKKFGYNTHCEIKGDVFAGLKGSESQNGVARFSIKVSSSTDESVNPQDLITISMKNSILWGYKNNSTNEYCTSSNGAVYSHPLNHNKNDILGTNPQVRK